MFKVISGKPQFPNHIVRRLLKAQYASFLVVPVYRRLLERREQGLVFLRALGT